jgi:enoyl-CoA hydratase/carnithine racemase
MRKPKGLNALDIEMVKDFTTLLPQIEKYPAFWVEGEGKAFCAGGDVRSFFKSESAL